MQESIETILRGGQFKRIVENTLIGIREKNGLKRVEVEVLRFLHLSGEKNTMTEICSYLQMNKGHISTAMDNLCKKGYLTQEQDPDDRRYIHYSLTLKAQEVVEQINLEWDKMMERMLQGIKPEDLGIFKRVAREIGKNIENILCD